MNSRGFFSPGDTPYPPVCRWLKKVKATILNILPSLTTQQQQGLLPSVNVTDKHPEARHHLFRLIINYYGIRKHVLKHMHEVLYLHC